MPTSPSKNKQDYYVLITCSKPKNNGKMEIELSYEGDDILASYLIEQAKEHIDEKIMCTAQNERQSL